MSLTLLAATLIAVPANPDLRAEVRRGYWVARLKLAKVSGTSALSKYVTQTVRTKEGGLFELFMKDAHQIQREFREMNREAELSYDTSSHLKHQDANVISVLVSSFTYLGGAHGMGFSRTYNFGLVAGKPKQVKLADLVGANNVAKVQVLLLEKIIVHPHTQWTDEGWLTELSQQQLNRFWISRQGITWEFDAYELASYAAGPFTFRLAWADLKPLLVANSPVGHLAR